MIKPILIPIDKGTFCMYRNNLYTHKTPEYFGNDDSRYIEYDIILIDIEAEIIDGNYVLLNFPSGLEVEKMIEKKVFCNSKCINSEIKYDNAKHAKIISSTNKFHNLPQLSSQSIHLLINYYNEYKCMPESVEVEEMDDYKNYPKSKLRPNQQGEIDITIPEVKLNLDNLGENCFNELKALNSKGGLKEFIKLAVNYGYNAKAKEKIYTEEDMFNSWLYSKGLVLREETYQIKQERIKFKEWFNTNKK